MSKISALLFDFGGTLDWPGQHWLDRFLHHYRALGIDIERGELEGAFSHATRRAYSAVDRLEHCGMSELLRFLSAEQVGYLAENGPTRVQREFGKAGQIWRSELADRIAEKFVVQSLRGLTRSRAVLERLSTRFKLGVVSNFYGNLRVILTEAGLRDALGAVIDSSQVQVFKPDPQIFELALQALGAQPCETAMIGDSIEKDCIPARRMGMRTVLMAEHPTYVRDGNADLKINSLEEIEQFSW